MQPSELGLPDKFQTYRPQQLDMAVELGVGSERFTLLSAPTGSGKSIVYMTAALLSAKRTLVLTSTKGLQQQLLADFGSLKLQDIRGQSNYRCVALDKGGLLEEYGNPGTSCAEGPCKVHVHCAHMHKGGCPYYDAIAAARESDIVLTNYAYWLTIGRYSDPTKLGDFDLIILDEAHSTPDILANFCAVKLDARHVKAITGMDLPPISEGVSVWAPWAREAWTVVDEKYTALADMLAEPGPKRDIIRELRTLSDLSRDLNELAAAHDWRSSDAGRPDVSVPGAQIDWIAQETNMGQLYSPVWAHPYAESLLFRWIPNVILTSATLQERTAQYLGIPKSDMIFHEYDSTFDSKRRPVFYIPTTRVDHKMIEGQVRQWVKRIDSIIERRLDRKGIIHTRSYKRAQEILKHSRFASVMITHRNSRELRSAVSSFKRSDSPAILVSPSVEEGFDFPHDECRYQIIGKVPFVDGRSLLMKARNRSDKMYQPHVTALAIIQQVGRGMRAGDDWCETFILDDHWRWFSKRYKRMFPAWFRSSWVKRKVVPDPMALAQ